MASLGPKSPSASSGASWTTRNGAYADGGAYAETAIQDAAAIWYTFDFSSLPSDLYAILGIAVAIDALAAAGMTTPSLDVELSWDSGSSWVTAKNQVLNESETTHTLGGAADTWGRTWARSEIVTASSFRARVTSRAGDPGGAPGWMLDWVRATVTYTANQNMPVAETMTISGIETATRHMSSVAESLGVTGTETAELLGIAVADDFTMSDVITMAHDTIMSASDTLTLTETSAEQLILATSASDTLALSDAGTAEVLAILSDIDVLDFSGASVPHDPHPATIFISTFSPQVITVSSTQSVTLALEPQFDGVPAVLDIQPTVVVLDGNGTFAQDGGDEEVTLIPGTSWLTNYSIVMSLNDATVILDVRILLIVTGREPVPALEPGISVTSLNEI